MPAQQSEEPEGKKDIEPVSTNAPPGSVSNVFSTFTFLIIAVAVIALIFPLHYEAIDCGPLIAPDGDPHDSLVQLCNTRRTQQISWVGLALAGAVTTTIIAFLTRRERPPAYWKD
ncbi:hypothetical protein [Streptomyces albidus (ex Kaewkla and Franco 2022)]|uniref:hypothetical protein n=1 Tax=Streptomyces albidus (ex Kaewkla and Franco 2022) TaxID=722709 RepID=UPI0015EEEF03|nr:hypothetical protein [Streptomyces albidus (ex Kaewkla and Franco 2022)]